MNKTYTLAKFATSMRAASLMEDLTAAGIDASLNRPKWTDKKLPPPMVMVMIDVKDLDAARVVYDAFRGQR